MQDAVAAAGTLLGPDTLLGGAAEKGCIDTRVYMGILAQVGDEVHADAACHGNNCIILIRPVIKGIDILLVALAHQSSFKNLNPAAILLGAKTDERGQQLDVPFAAGGADGNTSAASQNQDFLVLPGHLDYFGNRLTLGNYHADSPLSGLGPNF